MELKQRTVMWIRRQSLASEFAQITLVLTNLTATGVQIGSDSAPYRIDYSLETGLDFVTKSMQVRAIGDGWWRSLNLRRSDEGWSAELKQAGEPPFPEWQGDMPTLSEALDCDLGFSPVTNTMPILREGILDGAAPVEITVAWISVPDLEVRAERQRYSFVGTEPGITIVRFESLDGTFGADIRVDADGIVIDYPGIASRVS